jgi:hypothetical protein
LEEAIKAIKETPITIKKYFNEIRKDCIDNKPKYKKILLNCITKL